MADDLLGVLTRFHREVVLPDIERIVDVHLDARISPFREETLANFDAVFKRLDRLESEFTRSRPPFAGSRRAWLPWSRRSTSWRCAPNSLS